MSEEHEDERDTRIWTPKDARSFAGGRGRWHRPIAPLPLKAAYTVKELARAAGFNRRRLIRLLDHLGVDTMRSGSLRLVPLTELEKKAWPFWESIQRAERLRHPPAP